MKFKTLTISILIITIAAVCIFPSLALAKKDKKKVNNSLAGVEGMIRYLKMRKLPALEKVEPWQNKYGPGLKITTKHYTVYTTLLDPLVLSRIPGFMESAYNSYQKQLTDPVKGKNKMPVYIFGTRKQWEQFTKLITGKQAPVYLKIKAGAYCLNDKCVTYHFDTNRMLSVLAHEGWHQFNQRYFKYRLPSWLDEGIAMSYEASIYKNGLFTFDPSKNMGRLASLRATLLKDKMIPVKQIIGLNPGLVIKDDDSVQAFYSQSYALVRFLKEDDYGKRLAKYYQMLNGAMEGTWPLSDEVKKIATDRNIRLTAKYNWLVGTKLFEYYIGEDFTEIEKEYILFCKKLVYHLRLKGE